MTRPQRILSIFAICLVIVLAAMAWVSIVVIQLDRRDAALQRRAEVEESARLALWRMDSALGSILAKEDTRPLYEYRSFYTPSWVFDRELTQLPGGNVVLPSPLLVQPTPFVRLHFQIAPDGHVSSPQVPETKVPPSIEERLASSLHRAAVADDLRWLAHHLDREKLLAVAAGGAKFAPKAMETDGVAPMSQLWLDDLNASNEMRQSILPLEQKEVGRARNAPAQQQLRSSMEYQQRLEANLQSAIISKMNRFENASAQQAALSLDETPRKTKDERVASFAVEGDMKPLWVDGRLLLVRQAMLGEQTWIQGCWLDWETLRSWLLLRVADLLPQAQLIPLDNTAAPVANEPPHLLAVLPVRLRPGAVSGHQETLSFPIRTSLIITWCCTLLASAAVVVLVVGMVSLSERRGAFVSAVTHELRTPLTTFRMYTEMLAGDMVTDDEQRRDYLTTLRGEADRLGRLVENVLSYARLERNRTLATVEKTTVGEMIDRICDRLVQRTEQAGMELSVSMKEAVRQTSICTDISAVEQIVFNLVENACKYAAGAEDPQIHVEVERVARRLQISVTDHGPGMDSETAGHLFSPFSKSAKAAANSAQGVGLGLALCRRLARRLRGKLQLARSHGNGCRFELLLPVG
ncbi:MAG: sensor histidine kinase [Pirellulaceae bacterium]